MNEIRKTTAVKPSRFGGGLVVVGLGAVLLGALAAGPRESERDSLHARRERIEQMDAEGKAKLLKRQSQFNALPENQRHQLTKLHQDIANDARAEQLHRTMHGYYDWLKTLTPSQRSELRDLRDLPPTERVERIKQMRDEQDRRRHDAEGFRRWLDTYAQKAADRPDEQPPDLAPEDVQRRARNIDDPARRKLLFLWVNLLRWQPNRPGPPPLSGEALARLRESLSPETREHWEGMEETEQWREIRRMLGSQMMMRSSSPVTDAELAEFLQSDELSEKQRDWLLNLSVGEMRRRLTLMYLGVRRMEDLFGFPGRSGRPGRGGPPGGGPRYPGATPPDRGQRPHPPRPSGGRPGGPANGRGPTR